MSIKYNLTFHTPEDTETLRGIPEDKLHELRQKASREEGFSISDLEKVPAEGEEKQEIKVEIGRPGKER